MREIYLDFLHQSRPTPKTSWIMLAIGVGLGIAVMIANHQGEAALAAARDAARRAGSEAANASAMRSGAVNQRVSIANDPAWENLLTRLEKTKPKAISILQLEADGVAGTASIIAETNDPSEMLGYLGKLGTEPGLQQVVLSQHAGTESPANSAIRFTLRMQWGRP